MQGHFSGKVVLITGSTGNLGSAVVRSFLPTGARLILLDRHPDRLLSLYPQLVDKSDQTLLPNLDLLDRDQVEMEISQAITHQGQVDCLIHTIGGFQMGERVHEITDQSWEHLLDLNLRTFLNIARVVVPYMLERNSGKIVTVGARPALAGKGLMGAYSVAKAGILRLTESMSAELKSEGINVNCVLPGTIDTPQNRQAMPGADRSRWVSADSLAGVIQFLCSEESRDIHGAAIPVYGA